MARGLLVLAAALAAVVGAASDCKPAMPSFIELEEGTSDPCAFCRALTSVEKDVCAGKADPEGCARKKKQLVSGCAKVLTDPCCQKQPTKFGKRAVSCASVKCPMIQPECPADAGVVKDKEWWEGCCFDPETDCTKNKCQVSHGGCAQNAMCKDDSDGRAAICKCNLGYSGDGMSCDAVNNCLYENGNCDERAVCTNMGPGKSKCTCEPGYTGSGTLSSPCKADNPCSNNPLACDTLATCHYRGPGLHVCTCNPGYTGKGTPGNCTVDDLCAMNNGGCHAEATCKMDVPGKVQCQCEPGFKGDGKYCEQIDECVANQNLCDVHAKCVSSSPGNSRCECNIGYAGNGKSCAIRDNCKEEADNDCSKNGGICIMTGPATHRCECKPGYSGDGVNCQYVDVCKYKHGGCDSSMGLNASDLWAQVRKMPGMTPPDNFVGMDLLSTMVSTCRQTGPGVRNCSCIEGYEVDVGAKGFKCKPMNSCNNDNGGCHKYAQCIDIGLGRNLCQCFKGFRGDGINNCSEVNPCREGSSGCHEHATCTYLGPYKNRDGSYMKSEFYGPNDRPARPHYHSIGEVHSCKCKADNYTGNGTHCTKVCELEESDCKNNGRLHPAFNYGKCQCTGCQYPFEGKLCDECPRTDLDCQHSGKINKETCKCEACLDGFGGDLCDKCNRTQADCKHGGKLNRATCKCERCGKYISLPGPFGEKKAPIERWTGDFCNKCRWSGDDCVHASAVIDTKVSQQGKEKDTVSTYTPTRLNNFDDDACKCKDCMKPWGGALCETCQIRPIDCRHKSRLNAKSCQCEDCLAPWTGEMCNTCMHVDACKDGGDESKCPCKHGSTLNVKKCICEKPVGPWKGKHFEKCARTQDDCNNGVLNKESCKCEGCGEFWTGELCEVCTLSQKLCKNGGEFDPERCMCRNCRYPWGGSTCEKCIRQASDCLHGSVVNDKCMCAETKKSLACPAPWTGATCGNCPMLQSDCKNGGALNKEECVCEDCAPYGGKYCDVCEITTAMCKHGSVPEVSASTCSCKHPKGTSEQPCGPAGKWGGTFCDSCLVADSQCKHMSRLNPTLCQCEDKLKGPTGEGEDRCPEPWGGLDCNVCKPDRIFGEGNAVSCGHGGSFSATECKCTNCQEGWGGNDCNECIRDEGKCMHGSKIHDKDICKCTAPGGGNVGNWAGDYQETCKATCKNGGKVNKLLCFCECAEHSPGKWWKGDNCEEAP